MEKLEFKDRFNRSTLIEIHISDIHFGAFDPREQFNLLKTQFLDVIQGINFNILSIDGDLFDYKVMANSNIAMYATMFVDYCVRICASKGATMVIIAGTLEHDADQLKLFHHYMNDSSIDVRIVENPRFEYIKGAKILCIPEKYQLSNEVYESLLFKEGMYDSVFMHGTYKGAVPKDNAGLSRLFTKDDFVYCYGPVISGHVHSSGCFDGFVYYNGSPYCWKFGEGEEKPKGFLIVVHDLDRQKFFVQLQPIQSYVYKTLHWTTPINDPKDAIDTINYYRESNNIDVLRVKFDISIPIDSMNIIKEYFRRNSKMKMDFTYDKIMKVNMAKETEESEDLSKYSYLLEHIDEYEKLRRFINDEENEVIFNTADELRKEIETDLFK